MITFDDMQNAVETVVGTFPNRTNGSNLYRRADGSPNCVAAEVLVALGVSPERLEEDLIASRQTKMDEYAASLIDAIQKYADGWNEVLGENMATGDTPWGEAVALALKELGYDA